MARIEHTNIIIDDFSIAKRNSNRVFTHILTHIHTDHLKGLYDGWNYGPIYCSEETKNLLLYRYPSLTCIRAMKKHEPTPVRMSETLEVTVTLLDANHCVGAVMVLIEGYMGTVLYTGDIRFNRSLFRQYSELYPPSRYNEKFEACSKHIDVLYLDNTFLKKKFDFPPQAEALQMVMDFIRSTLDQNRHNRIFIGLDSIGKEEVLAAIAHLEENLYIVVDEQRYELLKVMGYDPELFTTNKDEGIIEVVRKNILHKKIQQEPGSIGIVLSGWVNHPTYKYKETIYCVPYSLHSNYKEIHEFVNSIRPTVIYPIVDEYPDENKLFYAENESITKRDLIFKENLFETINDNYQSEIEELRRLYCSPPTPQYSLLINDIALQKKIEEELLPPKLPDLSSEKFMAPLHLQTVERKKYKITNNRNEEQITRLKNQILMKKKIIEGERIDIIDDDGCEEVAESAPKNSSSKSVIDIDAEDIEIEPEIIEVDPFNEPVHASKAPPQRFKQRDSSAQFDNNFNQARLIQQIRNKLKSNKFQPSSDQNMQRKQNLGSSMQSAIVVNSKQQILSAMRSKLKQKSQNSNPKVKITASICDIRLEELDNITILDTKDKVSSYFWRNPEYKAYVEQFLQKQVAPAAKSGLL